MKTSMALSVAAVLVLAVAAVVGAQDTNAGQKPAAKSANGTVKSATANRIVVVGKFKGKEEEWSFGVDSNTTIKRGGRLITAGDVRAGDLAQVKFMEQGGKAVALAVTVKTPGTTATTMRGAPPETDNGPNPPELRGPSSSPPPPPSVGSGVPVYHALIIANSKYRSFKTLPTPGIDAKEVQKLLLEKYGFRSITMLADAKRADITGELGRLRTQLSESDSLLIYYAGHGRLDTITQRGYWLPIDADPANEANWLATDDITNYLRGMQARHVLIVADSCYSGALTRDAGLGLTRSGGQDEWNRRMLGKRARTALTSGRLEPVLDRGGGQNSVFARAFLDVLRQNNGPRDMESLYQDIKVRVVSMADQTPDYGVIRFADHDLGDFVFVPRQPR